MQRRSYASVVVGIIPAPISKNAPRAPPCPKLQMARQTTLDIRDQPGTSTDNVFKKVYLEHKIKSEIDSLSISDHRDALQRTASRFRSTLKYLFPDSKCWITGSYAAGLDIGSSDVDFTVEVPSVTVGNSFQKLMQLKAAFSRLVIYQSAYVQKARTPVLKLFDEGTKVAIDVSINNSSAKRNTQILNYYAQMDSRFTLLCKAIKLWASKSGVECSRYGRLNSFSLCLMVVHYLQVVQPAVLPNLQDLFPELNGEFIVENDDYQKRNLKEEINEKGSFDFNQNKSSVAVLLMDLLKYYSNFDFEKKWISVRRGRAMEKRRDEKREPLDGMPNCSAYIVVEDPFLENPWNCAATLSQDDYVARVQLEFREEYERILHNSTIFNFYECPVSRRITEEGKKRDRQINEHLPTSSESLKLESEIYHWGINSTPKWKPKAVWRPWPPLIQLGSYGTFDF